MTFEGFSSVLQYADTLDLFLTWLICELFKLLGILDAFHFIFMLSSTFFLYKKSSGKPRGLIFCDIGTS